MVEFVSRALREEPVQTEDGVVPTYTITNYAFGGKYTYEHIAQINTVDRQYIPQGVVAWTDAESQIAMPRLEFLPYENGVHSGPAVKLHEIMHIYIKQAGGIQDEKGINNYVAYKLGYDRFPFPSY